MSTFKVGDRVRHVSYGTGVIKAIDPDGDDTHAVELDRPLFGHSCNGRTRLNHGAWCSDHKLTLVDREVFFQVGDKVRIAETPSAKFLYHEGFNGRVGTVIRIDVDGTPDVLVNPFRFSQYIPVADLTLVDVEPVEAVKAATPKVKTITFKKGSQCDRLVKYMLSGNSVTPIKARSLFGAERLAARILEIKKAGHKVKTVIKTDLNGKVYAEYSLRNVGRVAA